MESTDETEGTGAMSPARLLADAERAAAAPYVDYQAPPWWYPLVAGLWAGAMVLTFASLWDHPRVAFPALAALIALEIAFIVWLRRRNQTMPSWRKAPREVDRALRRYWVGVGVVVLLGLAAAALGGAVAAAIVVGVGTGVGLLLYERDYAHQAAATRRRLA